MNRSLNAEEHDPSSIFQRFQGYSGAQEPGFYTNFVGARIRRSIEPPSAVEETVGTGVPSIGESYFEWLDVLQAVADAGKRFTMLEVGAGFGRWGLIGACAARQRRKSFRLGFVEADPKNVDALNQVMRDNRVYPWQYRIFTAAVGGDTIDVPFVVGYPDGREPPGWLGQAKTSNDLTGAQRIGRHFGHDLWAMNDGWRFIMVAQIPLSKIVLRFAHIDLADLDIQGAEADAVEEAVGALSDRVKRLHIGTHSAEVEQRLHLTLGRAGWTCVRDYPCLQENDTEFGKIAFGDGVQTWVNPRIA